MKDTITQKRALVLVFFTTISIQDNYSKLYKF